jgi:hypothetical protein
MISFYTKWNRIGGSGCDGNELLLPIQVANE